MLTRRRLIHNIGLILAAPAIVRASSLMQLSVLKPELEEFVVTGAYPGNSYITLHMITRMAVLLWKDQNIPLSGVSAEMFSVGDRITIRQR